MTISVPQGFTHTQLVAATTWVIAHGQYSDSNNAVEVFIDVSGERVKAIPKSVVSTVYSTTVTFSTAQTGEAYVI